MPNGTMLLVEDDPNDALLMQRAFQRLALPYKLKVVRDGQEASEYLLGTGTYENRMSHPIPDLIVLDLKLPRMNGFEFLAWLRAHLSLSATPVVILTSSEDAGDIGRARALGVASYLVKPGGFEKICQSAQKISEIEQALREGRPVPGQFPWVA